MLETSSSFPNTIGQSQRVPGVCERGVQAFSLPPRWVLAQARGWHPAPQYGQPTFRSPTVGSAEPHSGHLGFIAQPFSAAFASSFLLFLLFFCSLYFPLFSPLPHCLSLLSSSYSSVSYQFSFSHLPFHLPFIFYFSPFSFPRSPLFDSFTFCLFSSSSCPFPSHFGTAPFRTSLGTDASFCSVSTWLCSVEGMSPGPHWPPWSKR